MSASSVAVPILVATPDLRGRTPAAAAVVLGAIGLVLADEPHPTQESGASYGTIVVQTPAPEATTPLGSTVHVTLATPWTVEVPKEEGLAELATLVARAVENAADQHPPR